MSLTIASAAPWWAACAGTGIVVWAAWRSRTLRVDGAVAAFVIGVLALRVQWAWGAYLIGWFVLVSAVSRLGRSRKSARTLEVVMRDDRRDARQVFANGGVFAICALIVLVNRRVDQGAPLSTTAISGAIAAAGALAAAGADTWSTEIGTLLGGRPWSLRSGQPVAIGTSGAVTWSGTVGGVVGAVVLAGLACSVSMIAASSVWPVALSGLAGAAVDTLLGAWVQERRHCPACQRFTERVTHCHGTTTLHRGGVHRFDNDVVNVGCSLTGALVALGYQGISPA